ncbi:MAG: response regulator transcription factor [Acidimicrobiales bacterium]
MTDASTDDRLRGATVLVVEDERAQRDVLDAALGAAGCHVHLAATGTQGLELAAAIRPDAILLDLGLPDADGVHLCRHLEVVARCPIVVVTSDADDARLVRALDSGADDYITKPFSMDVLLARLRVALRHRTRTAAIVETEVLRAGDVVLDLSSHELIVDGVPTPMHARQFELLSILVRNQGRVVTYAALGRATGVTSPGEADRNAWRISVSKIRKQLGTGPRRPLIETHLNVGYRLVTTVEG